MEDLTMKKRLLLVFIFPLVSCIASSILGLILSQIGNVLYITLGQAGNCLAFPSLCGVFFLTLGVSFLGNRVLKKVFARSLK